LHCKDLGTAAEADHREASSRTSEGARAGTCGVVMAEARAAEGGLGPVAGKPRPQDRPSTRTSCRRTSRI
jgi:hypothetical protein